MTRPIDWAGRGPTWLGVPALVAVLIGMLMLVELAGRVDLSRELLADGAVSTADSVHVEVFPGKGDPLIGEVRVAYTSADGQHVRTVLDNCEDDPQGMDR